MREEDAGGSRDLGLLLIRVMVGGVFVFHGAQKLFGAFDGPGIAGFAGWLGSLGVPLPKVSAVLAACAEFFGGIALIAGYLMRLATIPLAVTMSVAVTFVHRNAFDITKGGMEYALTMLVVLVALGLMGPGQYVLISPAGPSPRDPAAR